MKKNKNKKSRIRIGRIYDLLLIPLYTVLAILFILAIINYTNKYTLVAIIILILILAIALLTLFYNKRVVEFFRRLLLTLLCGGLIFGLLKVNSLDRFFKNITVSDDTEAEVIKTQMNVYSLKTNENFTAVVNTMDDLDNKVIGIQKSNDKDESQYVLDKLEKKYDNLKTLEYADYSTMANDLYYGYIDIAIINADSISSIEQAFAAPMSDFTNLLKTYTHKTVLAVEQNGKDLTKEVFTVLISGQDDVGRPQENSKSDVNMVAIVNPISSQITLISIPRDSYVVNPAYNYENDKLTHTGNDGVDNTMKAIESTLQIDIDFYVKISFTSLIEIVDAVGGVDVNVPIGFSEQDENRSFEDEDLITLNAGEQTLNGKQALAFARHRHSYMNQDVGRTEAQMQVIKGIIKNLLSAEGLTTRIEKVLDIVPKYVLTNFSNSQLKSFIKSEIDDLKPWATSSVSLANGYAPGEEGYMMTASLPGSPQSVYFLKRQEVLNVNAIYNLLHSKNNFSDFTFDINNLYEGLDTYDETQYNIELSN